MKLENIQISKLTESDSNPRRVMGDLSDLAASIKDKGILEPVLVRPKGRDGHYEIVCGHRRVAAAKKAGLDEVPAISRAMDDKEALETQVVENCQRSDIHPIEEAEAFEALRETHGHTIETIAIKVGKSSFYVRQRLQFLELCKPARDAFLKGEINPTIALLVARIPVASLQEEAASEIIQERMTVKDAAQWVHRNFMLNLSGAPWKKDDADLVQKAGACNACPKNTANQRELFADVGKDATCTDPICWKGKMQAHAERLVERAEGHGIKVLATATSAKLFSQNGRQLNYGSEYRASDEHEYLDTGTTTVGALMPKDAPVVMAVDAEGNLRKLYRKADVEKALASSRGRSAAKKRTPAALARNKKQRAREEAVEARAVASLAWVADAAARKLDDRAWRIVIEALIERMWNDNAKIVVRRLGLEMKLSARYGGKKVADPDHTLREHAKALKGNDLRHFALYLAVHGTFCPFGQMAASIAKEVAAYGVAAKVSRDVREAKATTKDAKAQANK